MKQSRRGFLGALFAAPLAGPVAKLAALLPAAPAAVPLVTTSLSDDLADCIYNITPMETPFRGLIPRAEIEPKGSAWWRDTLEVRD